MLASFLFVFTILGQGAGPAIVAALTQYVFRDEGALGQSLAVVVTVSSILALISFRMALRYLAPAIASRKDV
jgi:hypothetical protein